MNDSSVEAFGVLTAFMIVRDGLPEEIPWERRSKMAEQIVLEALEKKELEEALTEGEGEISFLE